MTDRNMSSQFSTELTNSAITIYHLYEAQFVDGTVRFTDLPYDISFNSNTFTGAGNALGYEPIEEVMGLQANQVRIYFNATNASLLAILLDQNLIDRPVFIWRGLLDSGNQPVTDPIIIFEGRTDGMTLAEDPDKRTMTLALNCLDENADFERVNGRRTNNEEQQALFPGDLAFEFIADGMGKVTQW